VADEVRGLVLQMSATTALMQSQLREAERAITQFDTKATEASEHVERSFQRVGVSAGQMKSGMQQLGYQLNDVATQFSSGTKPMQIFAQQAGQTIQALVLMTNSATKLGAFLTGGWGIALTAGVVFLAPLIAKLFETGDAADKAGAKLKNFAGYAELAKRSEENVARIQEKGQLQAQLDKGTPQGTAFFANTLEGKRIKAQIDDLGQDIEHNQGLIDIYTKHLDDAAKVTSSFRDERLRVATATDSVSRAEANLDLVRAQSKAALDAHNITEATYISRVREAEGAVNAARAAKTADTRATREATKAYEDLLKSVAGISGEMAKIANTDLRSTLNKSLSEPLEGLDGKTNPQLKEIIDRLNQKADGRNNKWEEDFLKGVERSKVEVQKLSQIFQDGFEGGTKKIWGDFKQMGLKVIAEVLARFVLSNVAGGGGFNLGSALSSSVKSVLGFANGGDPPVGRPSLVGERGPELFVPKVPGTIIPNGGAGATIINDMRGAIVEEKLYDRMQNIAIATVGKAAGPIIDLAQQRTMRTMTRPALGR
jgi:hypothetical protein